MRPFSPLILNNLRIQFGTYHEDTRDDVPPRATSFLESLDAFVCGVGAAFPLLLAGGYPSHRSKPDFVKWSLLLQRSVQVEVFSVLWLLVNIFNSSVQCMKPDQLQQHTSQCFLKKSQKILSHLSLTTPNANFCVSILRRP